MMSNNVVRGDFMNENVKVSCVCARGYDKGVLKKTIENNIFTVYGNLNKNSYILLRYHGQLIDNIDYNNYTNNLYISYFFDGNKENISNSTLAKCEHSVGENYCALISLDEHDCIDFQFYLRSENEDNICSEATTFKLDIQIDPLENLIQKHGLADITALPVSQEENEIKFKKILNSIKKIFSSLFKNTTR